MPPQRPRGVAVAAVRQEEAAVRRQLADEAAAHDALKRVPAAQAEEVAFMEELAEEQAARRRARAILAPCAEALGVVKGTPGYCRFFAEQTGLEGYDCG